MTDTRYQAVLLSFDDWSTLYINGEWVTEGHSLRVDHILSWFGVEVELLACDGLHEVDQERVALTKRGETQIALARQMLAEDAERE